jgi:VWFA-related protein
MHRRIRVLLLLLGFFLWASPLVTCAQNTEQRPEGWQGPWPDNKQSIEPTPQKDVPPPGPQRPIPSGKQVLEIPSHPQSLPEPPRQQANIPPQRQAEEPRPSQLISVTVTDQQGRYVADLQREDFILYEDDVPQTITYFNTGEKESISLGILVDVSGSMQRKIDRASFALRHLITTTHSGDEIFVEAFAGQPVMLQDFTDSRPVLLATLPFLTRELRRQGGLCSLESAERTPEIHCGTSLYNAIIDGVRRVKKGGRQKKALVVISDGMDTRSSQTLEETIQTVQRSGVLIYTIGIGQVMSASPSFFERMLGEDLDIPTLTKTSESTGGRLFTMTTEDVLSNTNALNVATQTISRELRSQYSLGYVPLRPGSQYRNLRVETRRKDDRQLTVRAPQGYAVDSHAAEPKPRKIFRN